MEELRERLSEHMHVLCDQIGERHLGSEGEAKAADYIQHSFESSGYRVFREGFDAPGWTYGEYSLSIAETGQSLPCFPCYYSRPCDVTGKLLIVDAEALENLDVKGKLVLKAMTREDINASGISSLTGLSRSTVQRRIKKINRLTKKITQK